MITRLLSFVLLGLIVTGLKAQSSGTFVVRKEDKRSEPEAVLECGDETFKLYEKPASFPGGVDSLMAYLHNAPYPTELSSLGVEGSVTIKFMVHRSGKVVPLSVLRSSGDKKLDASAMQYIGNMPLWQVARQRGQAVNITYEATINYRLLY